MKHHDSKSEGRIVQNPDRVASKPKGGNRNGKKKKKSRRSSR